MRIDHENTLLQYLSSGINLFVGAGFSTEAKNKDGLPLPVAGQLLDEIINYFNFQEYNSLDLSQLSTILESTQKNEFFNFLKNRFSVYEYNPLYQSLLTANIKSIITTNIDNLWFHVIKSDDNFYLNDITISGPSYQDRSAVDYIPLHGCVHHNPLDFVFTDLNIAASFSSDPDKWHFLTERIQRTPTIFWGYSLKDAGVLQSLHSATINYREHKDKWIVLRNNDNASISFFESLGFKIIISETLEFLEYIQDKDLKIYKNPPSFSTKKIFPEYSIPELSEISVRSIESFYSGFPPEWCDIFTGDLHKISYYNEIVDSIYSKKHTIVIGIPVCGKTTLMMQVAYAINHDGHKLVCNSLTFAQAKFIVKKLNGERALIFVDNFSDDREIIKVFYNEPNIQFVAFDRSYFFDQISYKIDRKKTNILEISELQDSDINELYENIPPSIRKHKLFFPDMTDRTKPSVFELIEKNSSNANIYRRFKSVISELRNRSQILYQLLLMCCYVHKCRTPVSYDMVYGFLRDHITDYQDVYNKINSLGKLIKELSSQLVDLENQDYYLPRSSFLSEVLLTIASPSDLKEMLILFHANLSSFRICRYYIFKKRAYDAELIGKAFIDWKQGIEFYNTANQRDESPYLKQQCALYLMHKKRFKESFSWIDRALMQSDFNIPSIKNSHAIILFRANIDHPHDSSARVSLTKSMDILKECYRSDKRKTYHALVYSDHAIQFAEFFDDNLSREYLINAKKWLSEEFKKFSWNRNCKRMLNRLDIKLSMEQTDGIN
ncbi:conserved hypothetical protein [Candidatus Desulfarcum epimagneticum]|uniref:Novel STAND NTPase 5 domain-containing protein n=1 Tax=uncultured Desulfobacteraceae bacterium TaxID=218296 RepID=A0A484HHS8_9BACT|nr:conserved hypothetical protein [uncultured Desulfobacteraceae bacterium]